MTRIFTEEWLAQRELRQAQRIGKPTKAEVARTWNGSVDTHALANCEVVAAFPLPDSRSIVLPWPPTGNTAVRHANGAHYLRPEVTNYRLRVASILCGYERIRGPYMLEIELSPPDSRRRDCDNALKSMLDACVKCGWLEDDSMAYMKELHVYVKDDRLGRVALRAIETPPQKAA